MIEKRALLYEGKAKKLFTTNDNEILFVEYLNQVTALNGLKKDPMQGKGALNNQITTLIFKYLTSVGIENHFIEEISKSEQLIKKVIMFPLEVVVRNYAAGSFSKRLGIAEGTPLPFPVLEFYYKVDELDDPIINEDHVAALAIATKSQVETIKEKALEINQALIQLFTQLGIQLVDFKIEFGQLADGTIILADEISPDTCRLWDQATQEHLDKDLYRREMGDIIPVYEEVLRRLEEKNNL